LKEAYQALKGLRSEDSVPQPVDNPLAEPIWQLNKILAEELKRKGAEAITGKAKMRLKGQEVATRKIFVTKTEMLRLHGLLRDLHARFTKLGGGRKDIKEVLNNLKESLGTAGLGQLGDKVEEKNLEQLINFLPMRSRAMKVTLDDIREM